MHRQISSSTHDSYPPKLAPATPLTHPELVASLEATLAQRQPGPVWLFAYGSLIWRPECPAVAVRRARVHGYHRGLYLWSQLHRGTPEQPGLVLGLDRGGSCSGFAYQLPDDQLDDHLLALWKREMPDGSYRPRWLQCHLDDGSKVQALGFVLKRNLPCYAGSLSDDILNRVLTEACGHFGTTLEYVERTITALRAHAMPDRNLEALLQRYRSAPLLEAMQG